MSPHAWICEKLIVPAAFALAITPVSRAGAPSGLQMDRRTTGAERIALLSASPEQDPGEPQKATTQRPPPLGNNTVEQATPKRLQVTYEDGQLTIIAENSSLSDVMKALRAALATDIELPTNVAEQRVWVRLGPGPPRRVLRDLLDGTEFNYVIQASESDADGIRSVLLTQRSKPTSPGERAVAESAANRKIPGDGPDATSVADSENASPDPVAPIGPSQAAPPASFANQSSASASLQNTPGNSDLGSSKPGSQMDQMIQQLQSMYQQRRQIQIQQNQKPTGQN